MTISVDPLTYVITIPKADLTLVQSSPTEIRNLPLNNLRNWLNNWEDSEQGIIHPKTHNHNAEVSLGGLTYARIIEILEPYTLTFEDGQYAVNLVGANSNVADKTNVNQVSVRPQNSAGLVSQPIIEYGAFQEAVTIDVDTGVSGVLYPSGTALLPVNNIEDALFIAKYNGFTRFKLQSDLSLDDSVDWAEYTFIGRGREFNTLTLSNTKMNKCAFSYMILTGQLDPTSSVETDHCDIKDLINFSGTANRCVFNGTVVLSNGDSNDTVFYDCYDGVPGIGIPDIQVASCSSLGIWDWQGGIRLSNIATEDTVISLMIAQGRLWVDDTCVEGDIIVKGMADLKGTTGGTTIDQEGLITKASISQSSWEATTTFIAVGDEGEVGTDYPLGRPGVPVNNMVDALVIAERLGTHIFNIHGTVPLTGDLHAKTFAGHTSTTHDVVPVTGQVLTGCKFSEITLTGAFGDGSNTNDLIDCYAYHLSNMTGTLLNCGVIGTLGLGPSGSTLSAASCYLSGDVEVNFIADSTFLMHYQSGQLVLNNMIAGSTASITADTTGNVTIGASCTGGTLIIRGMATVIDNSGGAVTIIDQTASTANIAEEVWSYERV